MTIDWTAFTPWSALAGGAMIGAAAVLFAVLAGRIAGFEIDRAVVEELQRDSRATYAEIGTRVNLSAAAVHARVKNLERRGITEVLSFPPRSLELGYMDKLPERFEKLDGDGSWGLYRVLPAPAP